mgnify:CR=1 FL=1
MDSNTLFNEIRTFFSQNANPENAERYKRYFREGFDAYGVAQELMFAKVKETTKADYFSKPLAFELCRLLVPTGKYEETSFAAAMFIEMKKQFDRSYFDEVSHWFDIGIENWAHTDYICGDIFAQLWKKEIITLDDLSSWRISDRKFKRRAVPVSMLKLLKLTKDFEPLLEFINPMMMDTERVVHQGLGWFLREAWKRQPEPIEEFLLKWKNSAPRLIFQYATEKMDKEYRLKFRKEK